jgi:hypothetical protein
VSRTAFLTKVHGCTAHPQLLYFRVVVVANTTVECIVGREDSFGALNSPWIRVMKFVPLKFANRIRAISNLKAHALEIIRDLSAEGSSLEVTRNGEAKADRPSAV